MLTDVLLILGGLVLLVIGAGALMAALSVRRQLLRFDLPATVGLSVVLLLLGLDGSLSLIDGVILLVAFVLPLLLAVGAITVWQEIRLRTAPASG